MSQKLISDSQNQQDFQDDMLHYKQELETFHKYNQIMLKILHYQNIDPSDTQMPEWLDMLIQTCKTRFTKVCLVSASVFI